MSSTESFAVDTPPTSASTTSISPTASFPLSQPLMSIQAPHDTANIMQDDDDDDDWEEWDGTSPFWIHCAAGSLAGLTEHALVFPLDTIRTNLQVACSLCAQQQRGGKNSATARLFKNVPMANAAATTNSPLASLLAPPQTQAVSMWSTIRNLMSEPLALQTGAAAANTSSSPSSSLTTFSAATVWIRFARLWRGVQTMLVGCVPAHALYFSSYETVKSLTSNTQTHTSTWWGASLAGAAAVTGHDLIMTPLDTIKQRLQLGHYQASATRALTSILETEGIRHGLYKSLGVTLVTNIPYGMILVATQEGIKTQLQTWRQVQALSQPQSSSLQLQDWQGVLVASSMAGFVASAITTPLDRIKTCLQTQHHVPTCWKGPAVADCPNNNASSNAARSTSRAFAASLPRHGTVWDAGRFIYQHEGWMGFYRGLVPRVLSHTPAAAISWTTYETAKTYLLQASSG